MRSERRRSPECATSGEMRRNRPFAEVRCRGQVPPNWVNPDGIPNGSYGVQLSRSSRSITVAGLQ
jgi:hypothetical protein